MKRFLATCAIFPLLLAGVLSAAITGQWSAKATVTVAGSSLPQTIGIYATLAQLAGTVKGTAGTNGSVKPIQNVVISGSGVTFTVPEGSGNTSFALTDTGSSKTLTGTVTLSTGQILPVTFTSLK
jgi:hypothetical protein